MTDNQLPDYKAQVRSTFQKLLTAYLYEHLRALLSEEIEHRDRWGGLDPVEKLGVRVLDGVPVMTGILAETRSPAPDTQGALTVEEMPREEELLSFVNHCIGDLEILNLTSAPETIVEIALLAAPSTVPDDLKNALQQLHAMGGISAAVARSCMRAGIWESTYLVVEQAHSPNSSVATATSTSSPGKIATDLEVELLLCGALAHSKMGNLVEVKEYFDQLESVKSNLAVVPLTMGFICQETKALINDAKAHLEKAESIASAGGKRLMLTQVRHLQSNVIRQLRIEDVQAAAEQLMQESWEEYTDLNCIEGEAQVLDTIGNQLMQNEKLVEAEEYFVRSLTLKRQIHDFPGQAITLGNLSRLHFIKSDSSQWSKAENAASHNFAISNEIHEIKGMVIGSHMLGLICLARFDLISNQDQRHDLLEKAQLAFDNELDASKLSTNPWGVFLAHTGYLQVAIRESDWGKAEKLLQKMGRMCGETGVDYATPVQAFWRAIVQYQSSRIAPRHKAMSQVWSCYEKVKPFGGGTIYEQFRALGLFHTATQQNRSLPEPLKDKIVKELEERRKANLFSFLFK